MKWHHLTTGQFGYPQPEDSYFELTYDLTNACPTCQVGAEQRAPFRFRSEPKAKHSQFIGLNWVFGEVFVREPVKRVFEEEGVTGTRFSRPVRHKTSASLTTVYQLHVDTVLSPAIDTSVLSVERCEMPTDPAFVKFLTAIGSGLVRGPFCGREKYNYPIGPALRVAAVRLDGQPDLVRTCEWFGSGGSASRPILVSERVKLIIQREKWRGAFLAETEFF